MLPARGPGAPDRRARPRPHRRVHRRRDGGGDHAAGAQPRGADGRARARASDDALVDLLPSLGAYVLAFALVGRFWVIHHNLFEKLRGFDRALMALNLLFLALIVLVPFSTELYDRYTDEAARRRGAGRRRSGLAALDHWLMTRHVLRDRPDPRRPPRRDRALRQPRRPRLHDRVPALRAGRLRRACTSPRRSGSRRSCCATRCASWAGAPTRRRPRPPGARRRPSRS